MLTPPGCWHRRTHARGARVGVSLLVERVRGVPPVSSPPSPAWFSVVVVQTSAQANGLRAQVQARRRRSEPLHANYSTRDTAMTSMIMLPPFPGDDFFAHDATTWMEQAEPRLGRLLAVAQGQIPAPLRLRSSTSISAACRNCRRITGITREGWKLASRCRRRTMQTRRGAGPS